jgi:nitrite reductase/ring-hydroxylating ferredoxin subunit
MTSILPGAPWLIAHRSMLGINKPYKVTLNGKDYVLWQNEKGEIAALDNVCPHRQAPLSNGWVCQERNTIACPFHALEFDSEGRLYRDGKDSKALAKPLELKTIGDFIWTYGGYETRSPIPDLLERVSQEYQFLGVSGNKSIKGDFLSNLLVNYDFEHQKGAHREVFKIKSCQVSNLKLNGYSQTLTNQFERDNNTWKEIIQNPALLAMPKIYSSYFEYAFPSITTFFSKTKSVELVQANIVYPEGEKQTRTFVLMFAQFKHPLFKLLSKNFMLKAVATAVEQDARVLESLYPQEKPKIRLPNEEIMYYAEKLYREW